MLALAVSSTSVATSRGDQPLSVYKAQSESGHASVRPVALVVSGEGGWRSFDDQLATMLAEAGYWVGGIDSLKYFWKPQDDRAALAADVSRFADALIKVSGSREGTRVVLVGYSFGADLAPWIAGAENKDPRIAALVMIGPDRVGSLEARVIEILGWTARSHTFDTARALAASFAGRKTLSVVPGASHHFSGHEAEFRQAVVDGLRRILAQ